MPTYSFACNKCDAHWEIFQTMAEYSPPKKCPSCKSVKINRDYSSDLPTGSVIKSDDEITVGQLADRNRERYSEDHKESLYRKHNEYKPKNLQRESYKVKGSTRKSKRKKAS